MDSVGVYVFSISCLILYLDIKNSSRAREPQYAHTGTTKIILFRLIHMRLVANEDWLWCSPFVWLCVYMWLRHKQSSGECMRIWSVCLCMYMCGVCYSDRKGIRKDWLNDMSVTLAWHTSFSSSKQIYDNDVNDVDDVDDVDVVDVDDDNTHLC